MDIDYTGVPESKMTAAKVLFETVASVLNRSARSAISMNANFYEIGGNSLNSIFTITTLNNKGYHIGKFCELFAFKKKLYYVNNTIAGIGDFIAAMDFGEILDRMVKNDEEISSIKTTPPMYVSEQLKDEHKKDVIE